MHHAASGFRLALSTHEALLVAALFVGLTGLVLVAAGDMILQSTAAAVREVQMIGDGLAPRTDPAPIYQRSIEGKIPPVSPRIIQGSTP